jgi:hypothetical protein
MALYRKTIAVEATQHTGEAPVVLHTLEGDLIAQPGDWIITGPQGERYPCRDDIFRQTYRPLPQRRSRRLLSPS